MSPERSDGGVRILDAAAAGLFAAHASLRLSLKGGDEAWGANLFAHLLVPLAAAAWLAARALERRLEWRLTGFELPLAALAAVALITSFGASFRLAALDGAAGLCSAALAIPLAVHLFGPERRSTFFALLASIAVVAVLYGAVQYVQLGDLPSTPEAAEKVRQAHDGGEFAGRLYAREPWSTFGGISNTFGGFLVLALPFLAGIALDSKSMPLKIAALAVTGIGAFCLWATGSLGAWVASVGGAAAFGLLLVIRRWPASRRPVIAVALAGAAILAALVRVSPPRSESMEIRDVYWDAAILVAKDHPFGIGPANFEDYYYAYKDDRQEEVRQVHNDYLQVLAELGVPGLLAFLALLGVLFFKATQSPAPPSEPGPFPKPVAIGLGLGWIVAFGLQNTFGDAGVALLMTAAGAGAFVLARKAGFGDLTRIGLMAGLAAAAVHFLVDFDFTDPGFRHYFFLALAAAALATRLEAPNATGAAVPAVAAGVLFLITLPLAGVVAPRFLEADEHQAAAAQATGAEANLHWEAAGELNRLDPKPVLQRALADRGEMAVSILEDAIRRRPRYPTLYARLAETLEALAYRSPATGLDAAAAESILRDAERHARRAVELYPTSAHHRYLLGRILDASGQDEAAAAQFREALRLGDLARRVPRLDLDGLQKAVAALKTGDSMKRAVEIYRQGRKVPRADLAPVEKSIVDAAADSK
jgi:tetratricopeptide (TPR) repeat protein